VCANELVVGEVSSSMNSYPDAVATQWRDEMLQHAAPTALLYELEHLRDHSGLCASVRIKKKMTVW